MGMSINTINDCKQELLEAGFKRAALNLLNSVIKMTQSQAQVFPGKKIISSTSFVEFKFYFCINTT